MRSWSRVHGVFGQLLLALSVSLSLIGVARAQVYDFRSFISGGGGGQDLQKRHMAQSLGAYVCLGVTPGTEPGTVRFSIWSRIPQPRSRVVDIAFDMGRHAHLLKGVSVLMSSQGVKGKVIPAQPHPFLAGLNPTYWINIDSKGHHAPEGLSPGRMIVLNAKLGDGVTINQLLEALHEGMSPTAGQRGLRIGVIVLYLLGGPPPGVATIQDDGGFVVAGTGQACA